MSLFRRFLGPAPERSIEYLCQLMAEQNALQREVIRILSGRPASTPVVRPRANESRIRTDKDVFRVTRNDVIREDLRKREAEIAPWRADPTKQFHPNPLFKVENGQASAPESPGPPAPPPAPDLF